MSNTITTIEQMADLPVGQWACTDDGDAYCLFDTHMGFPQRMWGSKADGGTRGEVRSYVSLEVVPLPLNLADIDASICEHWRTNECGQCTYCGSPESGQARPVAFEDTDLFHAVARLNSKIKSGDA